MEIPQNCLVLLQQNKFSHKLELALAMQEGAVQ